MSKLVHKYCRQVQVLPQPIARLRDFFVGCKTQGMPPKSSHCTNQLLSLPALVIRKITDLEISSAV